VVCDLIFCEKNRFLKIEVDSWKFSEAQNWESKEESTKGWKIPEIKKLVQ
jgi:hypothetical protein